MDAEEAEQLWRGAQEDLGAGRPGEAAGALARYLEEFRDDWEVRLELARALYEAQDGSGAEEVLRGLAQKDCDARVLWNLGAVLGELGRSREELDAYQRGGEEQAPAPIHFNLGLAAAERGDSALLRRHMTHHEEAGGAPDEAAWLRGLHAELREDFAAAAEAFGEAAQGDPGWEAPYARARALLVAGAAEGALEALEEASRRGGGWEILVARGAALRAAGRMDEGLAVLREATAMVPGDEPAAHQALGVALLEEGIGGEAAAVLEEARRRAPQDVELRLELGRAAFATGDYAGAREAYDAILAEEPQHFRATYNRAFALERLGLDDEARVDYRRALGLRPGHYKSLNKLARLEMKAGELDEALQLAEKSLTQEGTENAEGYLLLAQIHKQRRDFDSAALFWEEASRRDPNSPGVFRELAFSRRQLGQVAEAKEAAKKAYAQDSQDADSLVELGLAYLELGGEQDMLKSRKAFRGALEIRPDFPRALAGEAQVSAELDPPEEAIAAAERAIRVGKSYRGHAAHGRALLRAGRHQDAIDAFKRCLQRNKAHAAACDGIAEGYAALGDATREEKYRGMASKLRESKEAHFTAFGLTYASTSGEDGENPGGS